MNLEINNTTCEEIIFNGHSLEKLYYGAHLVWEKQHGYATEYFTTTSLGNNNTIVCVIPSGITSTELSYIEWSKDKTTWNRTVIDATEQAIEVAANANENVYWRGSGSRMATNVSMHSYFKGEASFDVSGNIMSLLYVSNFAWQTTLNATYTFANLFSPPPAIMSHNTVVHAHNLVLPATTLAEVCYINMFFNCSNLVTAPTTLPATTLADGCYEQMFANCTSLVATPSIKATTLAAESCNNMFQGCTALTTVTEFSPTTLASSCCYAMFFNCTSLETAPELPATTLVEYCYDSMFINCSSLNYIKCLATDMSATNCLDSWVGGVAATGTFVKDANTTWPTGVDGIPNGWTVENNEIDYTKEYFQVISWEDNNTFTFSNQRGLTLYYSTDKSTWNSTSSSSWTTSLSRGQRLYFKGSWSNTNLSTNNNDYPATTFNCNKIFELGGNLCSLFYSDNFVGKTDYNGCYWIRPIANNCTTLLSLRNLILPSTDYSISYNYRWFCSACPSIIYGIKELPANSGTVGTWVFASFYESCSKLQESPVIKVNSTELYATFASTSLKRLIWLGASGYPSSYGTVPSGLIKYKLSTNTVSGDYRDFDTLLNNGDFISIWAEAETPYTGYVEGCSDYFVAGDTVTLEATALTGYTFAGYYDGDTLVSSNSTYTFTASTSKKLKAKFNQS